MASPLFTAYPAWPFQFTLHQAPEQAPTETFAPAGIVRSSSVFGLGPLRRPSSVVVVPTRASAAPALITSARNESAMVNDRMSPARPFPTILTQMQASVDCLGFKSLASSSPTASGQG